MRSSAILLSNGPYIKIKITDWKFEMSIVNVRWCILNFLVFLVYKSPECILILDYKCSEETLVFTKMWFLFLGKNTSLVSKNAPILSCRITKHYAKFPTLFPPNIDLCECFFFLRPYISYILSVIQLQLRTVYTLKTLYILPSQTVHSQQWPTNCVPSVCFIFLIVRLECFVEIQY